MGCVLWPGAAPEWTFVVGRGFLAAVPITTNAQLLESVRELDENPAGAVALGAVGIDDVLALLDRDTDEPVASLVVAVPGVASDADGAPVSVFVRGPIVVDVFSVGGSRRIADGGLVDGLRADFEAVTGLAIGSAQVARVNPDELESGQLIGLGAISGSALFWSAPNGSARNGSASGEEHAAGLMGAPAPVSSGAEAEPDGVHDAAADVGFGDTILRPSSPPVPSSARTERHHDADTVLRPVARAPRPREPVDPAHAPAAIARYGFRLPDGTERRLDAVYRLGRNPKPSRVGDGHPSRLVIIPSATSAVSATHLEIRQDGDSVVVTDVGSTNGTMVFPPRGRRQRLRAGQSLAVRPGTRVDIGDGNIIEVLR